MDVAGVVDGLVSTPMAASLSEIGHRLVIPMGRTRNLCRTGRGRQRSVIHAPKGASAAAASTLLLNAVTATSPRCAGPERTTGRRDHRRGRRCRGYAIQIAKSAI